MEKPGVQSDARHELLLPMVELPRVKAANL